MLNVLHMSEYVFFFYEYACLTDLSFEIFGEYNKLLKHDDCSDVFAKSACSSQFILNILVCIHVFIIKGLLLCFFTFSSLVSL